jgi:predicted Rossmann fold nucleotide-binding protein DprA/Smf involved in DNA uptake
MPMVAALAFASEIAKPKSVLMAEASDRGATRRKFIQRSNIGIILGKSLRTICSNAGSTSGSVKSARFGRLCGHAAVT